MRKWTIEQLNSLDDISFAIAVLSERRCSLNPYAPLAVKLSIAINTLEQIKAEREVSRI